MEQLPPFDIPEEFPTIEVDTPTAFALGEYVWANEVGLAQAVADMIEIGRFVYEATIAGVRFEVSYPDGEGFYEAENEIYDAIEGVKRITTGVHPDHQIVLDSIANDLGKTRDEIFVMLIEKARELRLYHRKKAVITMVAPDGSCEELLFEREK